MSLAPWRTLLQQSLEANKAVPFSRYCQLATVKPDGRPANRTVVYRGFIGDSDRLTVTTDTRSTKFTDLTGGAPAWGEICWYFTESREQYRMAGKLIPISKDTEDAELKKAWSDAWASVSPSARAWFTWPAPNEPRSSDEADFKKSPPSSEEPPYPNFCLLVFDIDSVELLKLTDSVKLVYTRTTDGPDGKQSWTDASPLNP